MKVYYDTSALILFSLDNSTDIRNHKYHPRNVEGYISFTGVEEALHVLFSKKEYINYLNKDDNEDKEKEEYIKREVYNTFIKNIYSLYKVIDVIDGNKILNRFLEIIETLNKYYNYLNKNITKSELPEFKDIIHFVLAEECCDKIITCDNDFEKFDIIKTKNIKKL